MRRKLAWLVLLMVCAAALVSGTGGFSAASMDRGVSIAVAESHEKALVSIWDPGARQMGNSNSPPQYSGEDPVVSNQTSVKLIVVQNQFSDQTIDVRISDRDESPVSVDGESRVLPPGRIVPLYATVDCDGYRGPTDALLEVHVTSLDGSLEGAIQYDATVVCTGASGQNTSQAAGAG